jgi:hypothetical protein
LTDVSPDELVEVELIGIPLDLQLASSEHQDGLRREFRMLVEHGQADASNSVPGRLIALAANLDRRFQSFGAAGREAIDAAAARGETSIDLKFSVPAAISPAAEEFGAMLEEADEYCSKGEHLLTLCTPPEVVDYRNWVLQELINQPKGAKPTPWQEYLAKITQEQAGT